MVATNTASDLELCASTYRHFSPAGFSSEIFIVENNSRVIQKANNKRIEKIKRENILRENFQIYGNCFILNFFRCPITIQFNFKKGQNIKYQLAIMLTLSSLHCGVIDKMMEVLSMTVKRKVRATATDNSVLLQLHITHAPAGI